LESGFCTGLRLRFDGGFAAPRLLPVRGQKTGIGFLNFGVAENPGGFGYEKQTRF
jgi:hypothetical protein